MLDAGPSASHNSAQETWLGTLRAALAVGKQHKAHVEAGELVANC
jgi:hypothetical protein